MSDNENGKGVSRRTLLGTTAAAAGVGLAGGAAFSATNADAQTKAAAPKAPAARPAVVQKAEVHPGELD